MKLEVKIPEVLGPIFTPKRYKIMYGGRGGGKSVTVAKALLIMGIQRKLRILCTRQVQKSLADSVIRMLDDEIDVLGLRSFYEVQKSVIKGVNGTEFMFTGLQSHTVDSLRSFVNIDIVWVEEAHSVSAHSWNVLIPTIRKNGSEIWATFNPDQEDDYVYERFVKGHDPEAWVCQINWRDNKWFPSVLEAERLQMKAINDDLYNHIWEGKPRTIAGVLFKRHWFKFYDVLPTRLNYYIASDYAGAPDADNPNSDPDFTEHGVWGLSDSGDLYAVDWWSGQEDPSVWIDAWLEQVATYKPFAAFEEKGMILRSLDSSITKRMRETSTYVRRIPLASAGSKADRALGFAARASAGTVHLPRGSAWAVRLLNQLCAFTGQDGKQDDAVDVCSLIGRGLDDMHNAAKPPHGPKKIKPSDYGDIDDDGVQSWKIA